MPKIITYEYIKEYIESKGYKLLSKEYEGSKMKLELECPKGHVYSQSWNNFHQGKKCYICVGNQKYTYEYVKEYIESKGYKLISKEYKNCKTKFEIECPKGHRYLVKFNNFKSGRRRCPQCAYESTSSKGENEVLEYIQSITDTTIIENDRTQIINPQTGYNLELDVFLPDLKKAIEYNGVYWHSDKETKYKDNQKALQCKEKEIGLLVIKDKKWVKDNQEVKNNIKIFIKEMVGWPNG